jgi:hypothetical protein
VKELEGQCLETQKAARESEDQTKAYFATINRSGNKIELVRNETEENLTDQERLFYISRKK